MTQFYFAWVDSSETTYSHDHARYDENVFSFSITHNEGDCAQLSLVIKNPKIGLLSAGRKVWAWLSYSDSGTAGATPLFFGRLIGIPDMQGSATGFAELLTLTFIAKPIDFAHQRRTLAESLAVLPFYDPLFVDEKLRIDATAHTGDVDTALEARSVRWHCSRGEDGLPLTVSISDINLGEDGTVTFESSTGAPAGVDPTSVSLRISGTPVTSATVKASVAWHETLPTGPSINIGSWSFDTYMGESIVSAWPKPGQSIGGGWQAAAGTGATDIYHVDQDQNATINFSWHNTARSHQTGDTMSVSYNASTPKVTGPSRQKVLYETSNPGVVWERGFDVPAIAAWDASLAAAFGDPPDSNNDTVNIPLHYDNSTLVIPQSRVEASLKITFDSGRGRGETFDFTMTSNTQPILTDPGDFDTSTDANPPDETILEINGADPTTVIGGVQALDNTSAPSYFATPRGQQSAEYLMLRARALLMAGARVVQMGWSVPFSVATAFTCRKNATLVWDKLPGGRASGKITGYTINASGDGRLGGAVTIMATVGTGVGADVPTGQTQQYSSDAGTGSYVDNNYMVAGYQVQDNQIIAFSGDSTGSLLIDLAYNPPSVDTTGATSALSLTRADVVVSETTHGSLAAQDAAITAALNNPLLTIDTIQKKQDATSNASTLIRDALTGLEVWLELELKTVDATGVSNFSGGLTTLPLLVPKTIDLEAT